MDEEQKPHLVQCILHVSPIKTDWMEIKRPIVKELDDKVEYSVPDPIEGTNFGVVQKKQIGKASQIIHYTEECLFIAKGYCIPDGVTDLKEALWDAVIKAAGVSYTEYARLLENMQQIILKSAPKTHQS